MEVEGDEVGECADLGRESFDAVAEEGERVEALHGADRHGKVAQRVLRHLQRLHVHTRRNLPPHSVTHERLKATRKVWFRGIGSSL